MEPTLVVVGLNHRTAAVEARERFWMSGCRQYEVLTEIADGEGIEEALVFSTCNRTEFVVWGDPTLAVNSILRLLTAEYDLKLSEWNSFYRLLDEQALTHAFKVSSGLDSMFIGEEQIAAQVANAWKQARNAGCTGGHLDSVLKKALAVRRRVQRETKFGSHFVSAPLAAVQIAEHIFESLAPQSIAILGAGRMAEAVARALLARGVHSFCLLNRTEAHALDLSRRLGFSGATIHARAFPDHKLCLTQADLVVAATASPNFIFAAEDLQATAAARQGRKLVLVDLGVPRNVDPAVRNFEGVLLYDLEDLERAVEPRAGTREGEVEAQRIVRDEVHALRRELLSGSPGPEQTALRLRLDEICRQELESFRLEQGPFPKDQDRLITAISARLTHKIAGSLARELKVHPETRRPKRMIAGM